MDKKNGEMEREINLSGYTIKIVNNGLDIEEVSALIKRLVDERDSLTKRQENLASLTRLYEKTVIDAGELAKQIEKEGREKVQKEATVILTQAHERAKTMAEQQQNEAKLLIQQRLKLIKNNVKKQLEILHKQEIEKLQSRIRDAARQISDGIIAQEESLNKQNDIEIELDENMFETISTGEPVNNAEKPAAPTVLKAAGSAPVVVKIAAPAQNGVKVTAPASSSSRPNTVVFTVTGKAEPGTAGRQVTQTADTP